MRPLELELMGFTSFRSKTLVDFRDLDLFAITGPTGAGKSSLIDAMIYALYGRAPRLNREINQLVSRGLERMSVRLDFQVEKAVYRVVRTSSLVKGKMLSKTILESGIDGDAKSVAGKAGDVEAAIAELIGLDYESFIRSVVLPQGEFDAFLVGEPKERQKILHHLLRMGIYSDMQRLAFARGAEERARAEGYARALADLAAATPEALAACREEGVEAARLLARAGARADEIARATKLAAEMVQALAEAAGATATAERIGQAIAHGAERLRILAAAALARAKQHERIASALAAIAFDETRHLALEKAEGRAEELRELTAALASRAQETQAAAKHAEALATAMQTATAKVAAAAQSVSDQRRACTEAQRAEQELRDRHGSAAELADHLAATSRWRKIGEERAAKEVVVRAAETEGKTARERQAKAEHELAAARKALSTAETELEMLRRRHAAHALRSTLAAGEPCPVCEQEVASLPKRARTAIGSLDKAQSALAAERRRAEEAAATAARLGAAIESGERRRVELGQELATLVKEEKGLARKLTTYLGTAPDPQVESTLRAAQGAIDQAERAARTAEAALARAERESADLTRRRDALALEQSTERNRLEEGQRVHEEREHRAQALAARLQTLVATQAEPLTAFTAALAASRQARSDRERALAEERTLEQEGAREREEAIALESARKAQEAERDAARATAAQSRRRAASLREPLVILAADFGLDLPETATGDGEARALAAAQEAQSADRMALAQRQTLAEARAREISAAIAKRGEIEHLKAQAEANARLDAVLDRDLKRDGFPAYLLEEALARLAADANRQLANFPNATFSLAADGQDFTVIDHANADERRSVRTLSGGESFIASLALAMAFAETLAMLAGSSNVTATLESLFLDEGFGTLDAENLDAVAGGLEALVSRARMVGVITHIPELAHRLPARILVSKRGNASEVLMDLG